MCSGFVKAKIVVYSHELRSEKFRKFALNLFVMEYESHIKPC